MLKQSLIYLVLSILVVLLATYAKIFFVYVDLLYVILNNFLEPLFGSGLIGEAFRDMVTLILTPLFLAALPALIYWLIKRKQMPYFLELTWLLWLILAMSSYLIH
ncbi:MAG: hypothetical protein K0U37_01695 [Gammaproteobacteria bacterium]|nr:hypothetical protein [Gammaproteobacteria bacterium]